MAFQTPGSGQETRNRKILEQLEEQKRRLRDGHSSGGTASSISVSTSPTVPTTASPVVSQNVTMVMETQHMTPKQRSALQHANENSVGYYITQDSSFGNWILPVLPRFNEK